MFRHGNPDWRKKLASDFKRDEPEEGKEEIKPLAQTLQQNSL